MYAVPPDATNMGPKLPISRLPQKEPAPTADEKRKRLSRTGKACTNCRKRKVRCSGEVPKCLNCQTGGLECRYDPARKDRLRNATSQNHELVTLLKDLSLRVDTDDKRRIQDVLATANSTTLDVPDAQPSGQRRATEDEQDGLDEDEYPASVGSIEDLDLVDENYLRNREARETGYMGANSEARWLKSVQRELALGDNEPEGLPYGPPGSDREARELRAEAFAKRKEAGHRINTRNLRETAFYLDGESLDLQDVVDPYQIPSAEVASKLLACFMRTVHGSFPILPLSFDQQFEKYFEAAKHNNRLKVSDNWLAILNLVFAIGLRFSNLTNTNGWANEREHSVFMTRAIRLMGRDANNVLLTAPDLGGIQATGLLSFYYLAIGHVSRSWVMIGVAIRLGLALGLHLRNEDESMPLAKKETLVRTWWSLQSVECLLSAITGRPCVLQYQDCTVDLPDYPEQIRATSSGDKGSWMESIRKGKPWAPVLGSSPAQSVPEYRVHQPRTFLDAHLGVSLLTKKSIQSLYAPRLAARSWKYIEGMIEIRMNELEEWKRGALPEDNGVYINPFPAPEGLRELTLLRFSYYSLRILITRPCLCRTERRMQEQSTSSDHFDQKVAEACVTAAQGMVNMLPDQPNPHGLYETAPWWSVVHHLMQAMSVLLLELSYRGNHTPSGWSEIPPYIKKLVRWLRVMRTTDAVAGRAYDVVVAILGQSNPIFHSIATQILAEDERGPEQSLHYGPGTYPSNQPQSSHSRPVTTYDSGLAGYGPGVGPEFPIAQHGAIDPGVWTAQGYSQAQPQPALIPMQSPTDMFSYTDWATTPVAYSNPFSTNFDQPNLLGMPDLWSGIGSSAVGAPDILPEPMVQDQGEYMPYNPPDQHQGKSY